MIVYIYIERVNVKYTTILTQSNLNYYNPIFKKLDHESHKNRETRSYSEDTIS